MPRCALDRNPGISQTLMPVREEPEGQFANFRDIVLDDLASFTNASAIAFTTSSTFPTSVLKDDFPSSTDANPKGIRADFKTLMNRSWKVTNSSAFLLTNANSDSERRGLLAGILLSLLHPLPPNSGEAGLLPPRSPTSGGPKPNAELVIEGECAARWVREGNERVSPEMDKEEGDGREGDGEGIGTLNVSSCDR